MIPAELLPLWRGHLEPCSGQPQDVNFEHPSTDYDRACAAAWPGKSLVPVGSAFALSLYTEFDVTAWQKSKNLVACGGWWPSEAELKSAHWQNPLQWHNQHAEYLLINSAADGAEGKANLEHVRLTLPLGWCIIEYTYIEAEYVGCFYRILPINQPANLA